MNRRASLPGADELFRSTSEPRRAQPPGSSARDADESAPSPAEHEQESDPTPEASGRIKHDQKITVYLTSQELLDLEQARLRLRAEFDIGTDRGRIVREAISELLTDLHERGPDSTIVRRLS